MAMPAALVVLAAFIATACSQGSAATSLVATPGLATSAAASASVPSASPLPSASIDPYAGLPSNACGGFHLKVVNDSGAAIAVAINDGWNTIIDARSREVINQSFSSPRPPPMPWRVVITDVRTGEAVYETTIYPPVDQKITISSATPTQAPYDLSEGC